jgi:large subunit ribosomal protein L13
MAKLIPNLNSGADGEIRCRAAKFAIVPSREACSRFTIPSGDYKFGVARRLCDFSATSGTLSDPPPNGLTLLRNARIIWVCRKLRRAGQVARRVQPAASGGATPPFLNRFFLMSTFIATAQHAAATGRWHVIDADGQVLGRIATAAARLLQGKHKPGYTPFIDTGDHVVVVNAGKVKLTGRKEDQKIYRQHSGYEGGLREERARIVRQRHPERLVEEAVRGMLPKTKLGDAMYRKLKVYAGPEHPHAAQKPTKLEVA